MSIEGDEWLYCKDIRIATVKGLGAVAFSLNGAGAPNGMDLYSGEYVAELKARIAALEEAAALPLLDGERVAEGWKLVPIEPTDAMFDAGRFAVMARDISGKTWSPAQHYEASGQSTEGIPPRLLEGYHSIIPKGQGACLVWAAMLAAAPESKP